MDGDQPKSNKVKLSIMIINIIKGRQIFKKLTKEKKLLQWRNMFLICFLQKSLPWKITHFI